MVMRQDLVSFFRAEYILIVADTACRCRWNIKTTIEIQISNRIVCSGYCVAYILLDWMACIYFQITRSPHTHTQRQCRSVQCSTRMERDDLAQMTSNNIVQYYIAERKTHKCHLQSYDSVPKILFLISLILINFNAIIRVNRYAHRKPSDVCAEIDEHWYAERRERERGGGEARGEVCKCG